jgi:hypothetical protein
VNDPKELLGKRPSAALNGGAEARELLRYRKDEEATERC